MLFTRWLWYSAIAGSLLKTVGQVHRIEVVALLIGLIYLVLVLLMWCRELDQVAFINVHIVGGAVVVWARLNTVVDNGRCSYNRQEKKHESGVTVESILKLAQLLVVDDLSEAQHLRMG